MHTLFSRHYNSRSVWAARLLIAIVLFWNLQSALQFMARPAAFAPAFQLSGVPGTAAVAGYGILFLMWQVPYIFALLHPARFCVSLLQALIMQAIGLIGESILLSTIPANFQLLRGSILRFIIFDGAGVLILLTAVWVIWHQKCWPDKPD